MLGEGIAQSLPGDLAHQVGQILKAKIQSTHNAAFANAKAIAMENNGKDRRAVEGLGGMSASIDPASYHYWQQREPGCWEDKQFMREYLRDNPEARVKSGGTKASVGYDGDGFFRHRTARKVKVYA